MEKHQIVYIGILNTLSYKNLNEINITNETKTVILSNIDFFDFDPIQFDILKLNNIILIPSKENIKSANKYKKSKKYTLFVDFLLKCPEEIKLLLNNDALLYVSNNDNEWHKGYNGKFGYAVSMHLNTTQETTFYGHSASLYGMQEKLILKQFDGLHLRDIN
jgi:hypothetical protein